LASQKRFSKNNSWEVTKEPPIEKGPLPKSSFKKFLSQEFLNRKSPLPKNPKALGIIGPNLTWNLKEFHL